MKYLKVFTDFADKLELLGDAERGRLFTAMLKYAESGAEPELKGNERFLWPVAKLQISIHDSSNNGTKGENHWNWKGGITPQNQRARNSREYREWRMAVFARDNFTCLCCGKRGGRLNAHHIATWADNPDKRYDLDNGITLCAKCHRLMHKGAIR